MSAYFLLSLEDFTIDCFNFQVMGYTVEYFSSDLQTGWVVAAHRITTTSITVSSR